MKQHNVGLLGARCGQLPPSKTWLILHRAGDIRLSIIGLVLLAARTKLFSIASVISLIWHQRIWGPKLRVAALVLSLPAFTFLVLAPNFIRGNCGGQLISCKSNLKNIALALEIYSTDNAGRYPDSLEQLTPEYLKTLPSCPCAKRVTYTEGYRRHAQPDRFSVYCYGFNHESAGIQRPNYPRYYNQQGLVER
jgi:hypothetical protein